MKKEPEKAPFKGERKQSAEDIKREKKREYMRKYHLKKKREKVGNPTVVQTPEGVFVNTEKPVVPLAWDHVLEALHGERLVIVDRHAAELKVIDDGIAAITRLSRREAMRPAPGTKVFELPPRRFKRPGR